MKKKAKLKLIDSDKVVQDIVDLLKKESLYESADLTLLDLLTTQISRLNDARLDIEKRGQMVNLRKSEDDPFWQINFSISIEQKATKIIQSIFRQFEIDVQGRLKRKDLKKEKKESAFANLQKLLE